MTERPGTFGAERARMADPGRAEEWRLWGPYLRRHGMVASIDNLVLDLYAASRQP